MEPFRQKAPHLEKEEELANWHSSSELLAKIFKVELYTPSFTKVALSKLLVLNRPRMHLALVPRPFP